RPMRAATWKWACTSWRWAPTWGSSSRRRSPCARPFAAEPGSHPKQKDARGHPFVLPYSCSPGARGGRMAQASALMAAARRLLWRAALFLWMMFLSATRSITLVAFWNTSLAAALSPAAMDWRTRLMAVRSIERRLELCLLRATDWRARLRAWAVLAMLRY